MAKVTIVMYHYVRDLKNSKYPEIRGLDISLFKNQLDYIQKHYVVVKMEDVLEALEGKKTTPANALLLTFDDAYKDHYDFVFPELKARGIQGSFFPPGKAIQNHEVLDVNKLHFVLASVEDKAFLVKDLFSLLDSYRAEYALDTNESYYNSLAAASRFDTADVIFIKRLLQRHLPEKLRNILVNNLFSKYVSLYEASFSKDLYMNLEQLKTMHEQGMYIGSHGWDHYWLDTLTPEQQENEIKLFLPFLESIGVDTTNWVMCYPYGARNESLITLLKKYGCKIGLTTEVDVADLATNNPMELPRLDTNDLPKVSDAEPGAWTQKIMQI